MDEQELELISGAEIARGLHGVQGARAATRRAPVLPEATRSSRDDEGVGVEGRQGMVARQRSATARRYSGPWTDPPSVRNRSVRTQARFAETEHPI